jgi:hypothetical protein
MKIFASLTLMFLISLSAFAQTSVPLKTVEKIYVGSMGQTDESERFRLLLAEQLSKVGFTSVSKSEDADATLTGVLTVRVYADTSIARATVVLSDRDGQRIWGEDVEPRYKFGGTNDTVKFRAENVAKDLRKVWKKEVK